MEEEEWGGIVIDNGTDFTKAGLSGDQAPSAVFPTVVGRPKRAGMMIGMVPKDVYVGDETQTMRDTFSYSYPIRRGIIEKWEEMEHVWHHVFYKEIRIPPEEQPVMLSEQVLNPKANRERTAQIMFEVFNVPSLSLSVHSALSLYASGRTTGVLLDSGDGVTHAVSLLDGYAMPHSVVKLEFAGRDVTEYLMKMLGERGYSFSTRNEREIVRDIKEKLCYVELNYEDEMRGKREVTSEFDKSYELPDGQAITVGDERFRCAEALFQPALAKVDQSGIHGMVHKSVLKCGEEFRETLFHNIVLSGGSTMFPYLDERLALEMTKLAPASIRVKVVTPPERKYSVWIGGSLVSSLSTFSELCITKDEYDEQGPSVVHRKCP